MATLNDIALKLLIGAEDQTGPGVTSARDGIRSISTQLDNLQSRVQAFLAVDVLAGLAHDAIDLADGYKTLQARIEGATKSSADAAKAQQDMFRIAQEVGASLDDMSRLYARSSDVALKFGADQATVSKFVDTVALSFKAQSSNAAETSSTITQLTQAIATDAVQWEDFGQLADTNLKLVNLAAKNLGYDGIGALKQAMSDGQVANTALINAVVAGYDEMKAAADKMPLTVEQSWQRLINSTQRWVGEQNNAVGATAAISKAVSGAADNIDTLASTAISLGEVLAASLVRNLVAGSVALAQNVIQQRAATIAATEAQAAQLGLAQAAASAATIKAKNLALTVEELQLQKALAVGMEQQALAQRELTLAMTAHSTAMTAAAAKTAAYEKAVAAATPAITGMQAAMAGVNGVFTAFLAYEVGKTIGEWASKFEWFNGLTLELAESIEVVATAQQHFFSGDVLAGDSSLAEKIDEIRQRYKELAAEQSGAGRQAVAASEQEKKAATDAAQHKIQVAEETAKQLKGSLKDYLKEAEDAQKQELAAVAGKYESLKNALDASNVDQSTQAKELTRLLVNEVGDRVAVYVGGAEKQLAAIKDSEAKQLAAIKGTTAQTAEITKALAEDRRKVYEAMVATYRNAISDLINEDKRHLEAAQAIDEQIAGLALDTEDTIRSIRQRGMSDWQVFQDKQIQASELESKARAALAEGDIKTAEAYAQKALSIRQDVANTAEESVKAGEVTQAAVEQYVQGVQSASDLIKSILQAGQQNELQQHEQLQGSITGLQARLGDAQATLQGFYTQLSSPPALHVAIDDTGFTQFMQRVNDFVNSPATKVIQISEVPAAAGGGPVAGFAVGGPVQNLADGGTPRRRLQPGPIRGPGTGTSDSIPVNVSNGEYAYIVNAQRARQTHSLLDFLNFGADAAVQRLLDIWQSPVPALQFAGGGVVPTFADYAAASLPDLSHLKAPAPALPSTSGAVHHITLSIGNGRAPVAGTLHGSGAAELIAELKRAGLGRAV
ncbi:MAG: hypothetical protein EPN21_13215 [Methylococcaceae bacterium]|nr:MAG: hypothetical protein EPN21_13215 [Methylococcaceae bacterium]